MSFKDIVNRNLVNLQNCEDEPIHIPGLIQPHGFLLSVDVTSYMIMVCSENVYQYLNYTHEQLLTQPIASIFGSSFSDELTLFTTSDKESVKVFNHLIFDKLYAVSLHLEDDQIIIEGELLESMFTNSNELYNSSKQLLSYIEGSFTLKELAHSVTVAIKNITNYDRVMVYRFDEKYNGEVIAESKEAHLESYLGLHYPHTDIPAQARELYIKNHLRIIGDINYTPVPLFKANDTSFETLDLSRSVLRSVSPIHIQYLRNMGVRATLTISLLHKGKLWGLITCHHYKPKYLSHEIRNTVKLHGHFITSQIEVRLLNEEYKIARKANQSVEKLTSEKLDFDRFSIEKLYQKKATIKLCNSAGAAALIDNTVYSYGKTPNEEEIKKLSFFLHQYCSDGHVHMRSLARVTSDLGSISSRFPGINYYSLGNETDCLLWFKEPTTTDIHWAGNPHKSIDINENGLSPRLSFATFIESVKDSSSAWLKSEINATTSFYNFFMLHLRSILLTEEKEIQRKLTDILRDANAELENINWISTHDLQEPLRKIRMMASILVGDEMKTLPDDVQNKILKMQTSAERMQTLITDILKYTKTSVMNSDFELTNLNTVFDEIKTEINDSLEEHKATLQIGDLPTINGIAFLLKQLFSNLLYNALKFKNTPIPLVIEVTASIVHLDQNSVTNPGKFHQITIKDNGIGFDNQYNEKIFKIFSRLNNLSDYSGSGIGLALCKKIMTKHNGIITADGAPNEGAQFYMYFPVS